MNGRVRGLLVLLFGFSHDIACGPAIVRSQTASDSLVNASNLANLTNRVASIPPEFHIDPELALPFEYPLEACFTNIIAALKDVAVGDFTGDMPNTNYRTTRFFQPLIKINSPGSKDIKRQFVVWGAFLTAFYLHTHKVCHMGFFSLHWKGPEVAGIGITSPRGAGQNGAVVMPPSNDDIHVDFAFFGDARELGKGAVFMIIISALMEAAPQAADDNIYETLINFLTNEPAALIMTPSKAAREVTGPHFTNTLLIGVLARVADYYAASNIYRQLELNVSVNGVMVAQGAVVRRDNFRSLGFLNATEVQEQALSIA
ncbi:MAG: hypothetical protein Q9208_008430 [Pyrenodesmia sp. 3 TL-2023]